MKNDYSQFEQRKRDHIELALMPANQSSELNPFDALHLIHEAMPDINFNDISIKSTRFNQKINTPFIISSMSAGHEHAANINFRLMEACAQTGWAMGVGSQRRELTDKNAAFEWDPDKNAAFEWDPLRKKFPDVNLFSNIGIAQIITTPAAAILRHSFCQGSYHSLQPATRSYSARRNP